MKIEVLFPEFANLFGDCWTWRYLARCMPQAELIETGYGDEPSFVSEKVDMIIMGAMTEHGQELAIKKLMPYRDRLRQLMGSGVVFLMTANAGEVFCEYIENEDGSRIAGLGLVPLHAKRDMMRRFNSTQLCAFEDMELVGFKAEFSQLYGDNSSIYFAEAKYGIGINKKTKLEGVRIKNYFSTSMVGPFIMMNPPFVKYLMRLLGITEPKLLFEETNMAAYERRRADIIRMMGENK